jgi:hypothetical protein
MLQYRDGQLTSTVKKTLRDDDWRAASDTFILWMIGDLRADGTHGGYVYEAWLYDSSDQVPPCAVGARGALRPNGMVKHHEAIARVFSDGRVVSVGSMVTPNPILYQRGAAFLAALQEIP